MTTANKNLSFFDKNLIPDASDFKFGIVVSKWNKKITDKLLNGVLETLKSFNVSESNIIIFKVPGSFELIYGAKKMNKKNVDVIICLGSIIRGETKHFDFISSSVANGIKDLNIHLDIPVIFGVLTDDNEQQAIDRSGGKYGNKGVEAAITAIEMLNLGR
jgi:6,7-dimethyl-8-ribityllumazine synthase